MEVYDEVKPNIIKTRSLYTLHIEKTDIQDFVIEKITLFDDMQEEYPELKKFSIQVYSPNEYYYNGILNSGVLKPEEAWDLYVKLFKNQSVTSYISTSNIEKHKDIFINIYKTIILYYKNNNIL